MTILTTIREQPHQSTSASQKSWFEGNGVGIIRLSNNSGQYISNKTMKLKKEMVYIRREFHRSNQTGSPEEIAQMRVGSGQPAAGAC